MSFIVHMYSHVKNRNLIGIDKVNNPFYYPKNQHHILQRVTTKCYSCVNYARAIRRKIHDFLKKSLFI